MSKSGYVEVTRGEFETPLIMRGYVSVGKYGSSEVVYEKVLGRVRVQVYSSVEVVTGRTRPAGVDAIRIVLRDEFFGLVSGWHRTNRAGRSGKDVIERVVKRAKELEERALWLGRWYGMERPDIATMAGVRGQLVVLRSVGRRNPERGGMIGCEFVCGFLWKGGRVEVVVWVRKQGVSDLLGDCWQIGDPYRMMGSWSVEVVSHGGVWRLETEWGGKGEGKWLTAAKEKYAGG